MEDKGSLEPGRQLVNGRFTLIRLLGQGGMGEVWLASDTNLRGGRHQAALKFVSPRVRHNRAMMDCLREELENSLQLSHDNILRIHDLHTSPDDPPFILMEFVDGLNLLELIRRRPTGRLEWHELEPYVRQLCSALHYAHSKRVIHRDLKPRNILLDRSLRIKLADFGLARFVPLFRLGDAGPRAIEGTLPYMSPQQFQGDQPTISDDIYAFGATLYELLTGTHPLAPGEGFPERLQNDVPETPSHRLAQLGLVSTLPLRVEQAVMSCLAKDPAMRPASVFHLARRLGVGVADGLDPMEAPVRPVRPVVVTEESAWPEPEPARMSPGRDARDWTVVSLVVAAIAGGFFLWKPLGERIGWMDGPVASAPASTNRVVNHPSPAVEPQAPAGAEVPDSPPTSAAVQLHVANPPPGWEGVEVQIVDEAGVLPVRFLSLPPEFNLQLPAGDYRVVAGRKGTKRHFLEWINFPATATPGANRWVLDFGFEKEIEFKVDSDANVICADMWGNSIRLSRNRAKTSEGMIIYGTPKLRQGTLNLTVIKDYFLPQQTTTFHGPSSRALVTLQGSGKLRAQPAPELDWTNSVGAELAWVGDIWVARHETTVTQWWEFATATGFGAPTMISVTGSGWADVGRSWRDTGFRQSGADHPVVGVNWHDATNFCAWLTDRERGAQRLGNKQHYRLPTDAEWGRIAQDQKRRYPWGDDFRPTPGEGNYAGSEILGEEYPIGWPAMTVYVDDYARTAPVTYGKANEYGLFGLGGNIAEWCADWYSSDLNRNEMLTGLDPGVFQDDPNLEFDGGGRTFRVIRGSSWVDGDDLQRDSNHIELLLALRRFARPEERNDRTGFRMVLEGEPDE
ncbi:MAG: protein kinase [Verrucomicrobiales bacterium]|nr:protein kinase [Verrucomicrobiales bacterium]MCP5527021.1 protein kinase [Verrucomicrobiales bacterium]